MLAGPRLLPGLDQDASAVLYFYKQAVPVQQPHTYKRGGVGQIGLNLTGAALPQNRCLVHIESGRTAIGQTS